jgi:hypothetical protein
MMLWWRREEGKKLGLARRSKGVKSKDSSAWEPSHRAPDEVAPF